MAADSVSAQKLLLASGAAAAALLLWRCARSRSRQEAQRPPLASPWIPLLGNALAYKGDPAAFLEKQRGELGGCFTLDLAGLKTTIVSGREEMMQVATASEEVLSARAAVADFGFNETLGEVNVGFGTDLIRSVVMTPAMAASLQGAAGGSLASAVQEAVRVSLQKGEGVLLDTLAAMRRMALHAVVIHLIGKPVLEAYDADGRDFLTEFMGFQDRLEDATAKGVTLPAWLSRLVIWRPVKLERRRIIRRLAGAVQRAWDQGAPLGQWLGILHSYKSRQEIPAWKLFLERQGQAAVKAGSISSEEAAELAVGLLFASHKNPAIGAAQTLLMLMERPEQLGQVVTATRNGGSPGLLQRSITEALRLTAHTLGGLRKVVAWKGYDIESTGADGRKRKWHVPHGDYVALSHSLPNRNPALFPEPLKFHPDRLVGTKEYDEYELTTFSQGRHRCPGKDYAMRLMELLLTELLRSFEVSKLQERPFPPLSYERATLAQRAGPCSLSYIRR